MTINQQPKIPMHAVKPSGDPLASQEARRATEDASGSAVPSPRLGPDSEVVPRARRRHLSNADKRRVLEAADRCTKPGEIGALMRREGVYSSLLSTWRRQREAAELVALARAGVPPASLSIDPAKGDFRSRSWRAAVLTMRPRKR